MITECKFEILRNLPRLVRPVNFSTEFDHDVPLPGRDEDDESDRDSSNGRMSGEGAADDDVVDDMSAEASGDNAYADEMEVQSVGSEQRAAIIRVSLIDAGIPGCSLLGDVSELRGYLRGRLGL